MMFARATSLLRPKPSTRPNLELGLARGQFCDRSSTTKKVEGFFLAVGCRFDFLLRFDDHLRCGALPG